MKVRGVRVSDLLRACKQEHRDTCPYIPRVSRVEASSCEDVFVFLARLRHLSSSLCVETGNHSWASTRKVDHIFVLCMSCFVDGEKI